MNVLLLGPGEDYDFSRPLPPQSGDLITDLGLDLLFDAMAGGDRFVRDTARHVIMTGARDPETVLYRQGVLKDCRDNTDLFYGMLDLAKAVVKDKRSRDIEFFGSHPSAVLQRTIYVLEMLFARLEALKKLGSRYGVKFRSAGFERLFGMLSGTLSDSYLETVRRHLKALRFDEGVFMSAELGPGNGGSGYTFRKPNEKPGGILKRAGQKSSVYTMSITEYCDLENRAANSVINSVAHAAEHIVMFFKQLYAELAFYAGCLALHGELKKLGAPTAFPLPEAAEGAAFCAQGLYDLCLLLSQERMPVDNDVSADGKGLVIITGANYGGKSTFLRSVGVAQLMLQSGMFVPAAAVRASVVPGVFTHFKREEDRMLESGKLDEELRRLSGLVDHVEPGAMMLLNESFASTNEREGAELARQITLALAESRVRIFFVTHIYEYAKGLFDAGLETAAFLKAERLPDGTRSFKLVPGEPLKTSFADDLFGQIVG